MPEKNPQLTPRVLYLSYAFPPGVSGRFPHLNPAGHAAETRMIQALRRVTPVNSVGMLGHETYGRLEPRDESMGLDHDFLMWSRSPEIWHRWRSFRSLCHFYRQWTARHGRPEVVLVKNFGPVYNGFIRWLRRQSPRPLLALLLADSGSLGQKIPLGKRLRYAFKPMVTLDEGKAIRWFDACISFGIGTRQYFEPRGIPWMWMPAAYNFTCDPPAPPPAPSGGPVRFGYFGALAEHATVIPLVHAFLEARIPGTLRMCGHGKLAGSLQELAARHSNFIFDGMLPRPSDCLDWARQVDVLVNPRLPHFGLENSFPSKIFEYGVTGKAILTTRTGGVDQVLGDNGLYLETENFLPALASRLREVSAADRADLNRRGAAIREKIVQEYTWDAQARRMVDFLGRAAAARKSLA